MPIEKESVIVIAGPTASGKSGLALRLAATLATRGRPAEIICADSVTVYRGFEIGAAKPTQAERKLVPHHLLDVADPREPFTAGDFVRLSLPLIHDMHARGVVPLVVGGTGFYLRALLRGMASNEAEDSGQAAEIKAKLMLRAETEGYEPLHRELLQLDPGSASTVHVNDHYRILRALQAMAIYKQPWSELNKTARAAGFRFPGTQFFCLDVDREVLRARIELRALMMLEHGLLDEVRELLATGLPPTAKPLLSVGYKECLEVLRGLHPEKTLAERITQSTTKLAKQQRTWFRGETGVQWLKPDFWEELKAALQL